MDWRSIATEKEALTDGGLSKLDKCRSMKLRFELAHGTPRTGIPLRQIQRRSIRTRPHENEDSVTGIFQTV
jgi:hypothetical protein